ncbi:MAG: alginate export family protein [Planctomycetaceae bacterium]|nr:alginate export family protein [Planctomycetaceae bacterium]
MFARTSILSLNLVIALLVISQTQSQAGIFGEKSSWFSSLDNVDPWISLPKKEQIGSSDFKLTTGGSLRYRYINEVNRLRPPGAVRTDYSQWRFTPFMELNYKDDIKGFVKIIDADTFGEDVFPLPIDENRWDILEAYIDAKVMSLANGDVRLRYGRQMLNYGKQRTVSPLAWANTYRNFEGLKGYYRGEDWNIDAFAVRPLNAASRGTAFKPDALDTPDQSNLFSGIYATKKNFQDIGSLDTYWLWSNEREENPARQDGNRHTFGARIYGSNPITDGCCDDVVRTWAWDLEGAMQFGSDSFAPGPELDVYAGFMTADLAHTWNQATWTPTVKGLFYYGSGDSNGTDNKIGTYYSMYPLGHAYWGMIDNFSGQNLIDYSVQASVKPSKKLGLSSAFHYFTKAQAEDAIYNIAGAGLGATGAAGEAAGEKIGTELDLLATYKVNSSLTLQGGYFWFWYGNAVQNGGLDRDDASQIYFLANYDF